MTMTTMTTTTTNDNDNNDDDGDDDDDEDDEDEDDDNDDVLSSSSSFAPSILSPLYCPYTRRSGRKSACSSRFVWQHRSWAVGTVHVLDLLCVAGLDRGPELPQARVRLLVPGGSGNAVEGEGKAVERQWKVKERQ